MDGEYWLKRQKLIGHWARICVHVEPAEQCAVRVLADAGVSAAVTVTRIEFAPADTSAKDVQFATAWAVWQAIGHKPVRAPDIDDAGVHFPAADD